MFLGYIFSKTAAIKIASGFMHMARSYESINTFYDILTLLLVTQNRE